MAVLRENSLRSPIAGLACTLALGACVPVERLALPDVEGARTLLLAHETDGALRIDVLALDPMRSWARTFQSTDLAIVALAEPLESLQLAEGILEPATIAAPARALPAPLGTWRHDDGAWTAIDVPPAIAALRLQAIDFIRCASAEGCIEDAPAIDGDVTELCNLSCMPEPPALPRPPAPPIAAEAPTLTPCAAGWSEVASTPPHCEPPPLPARATCTNGQVQPFRAADCEPLGAPCPMGEWPEDLPGGVVLHVRAGAAPGGSGGVDDPIESLARALSIAPPGAVIALSAGRFDAGLPLTSDVTIAGLCAGATELVSTGSHVLEVSGAHVRLTGVSLRGGATSLRAAGVSTVLEAEGVAIEGATAWGLEAVDGARVVLRDVSVRDFDGAGLVVNAGAEVSLTDAVITDGRGLGVLSLGTGTSLRVERLAIRDLAVGPGGEGSGIIAGRGTTLDARGLSIERCGDVALRVDPSAAVIADDVDIAEVSSGSNDGGGYGIFVEPGGQVQLSRVRVSSTVDRGLTLLGRASTATITDLVVHPSAAGWPGSLGIDVLQGSRATLSRVWIEGARHAGLSISDGASVEVRDVVVRSTRAGAGGNDGPGIVVRKSATATIARAHVEDNVGAGLQVIGARAALEDVTITGTQPTQVDLRGGFGLITDPVDGPPTINATVTVDRAHVSNSRNSGIVVGRGTRAVLRDVVVRDTEPEASDGAGGTGILGQERSHTTIARADVEGSFGAGVMVWRFGVMDVEDLAVRDTRQERGDGVGHAVYVADDARMTLDRADLRDSAQSNLWIRTSTAIVHDLRASGSGRDNVAGDYDSHIELTRALVEDGGGCELNARDDSVMLVQELTTRGAAVGSAAVCVIEESRVDVRNFELSGGGDAGLYLYGTLADPLSASATMSEGSISGFAAGAAVVGGTRELRTLFERVRFTNNGRVVATE
jgi:hypothetical protein